MDNSVFNALGIDLSSQSKGTSACLIEFSGNSGKCRDPHESCLDEVLDKLVAQANAIGIDAPFGWPSSFAKSVSESAHHSWDNDLRNAMRFRATDKGIRKRLGNWPLSVSTDLIALPAMRAKALLNRHAVKDKSGGEKVSSKATPKQAF